MGSPLPEMETAGKPGRGPPWLFLLHFGILGMLLSEAMSWNMGTLLKTMALGPGRVVLLLTVVHVLYVFLLAGFVHHLHAWRVRTATGVLLLGAVYGLLNEGVFADLVFRPGFFPRVAGLHVDRVLFPTLSWHSLFDVGVCLLSLLWMARGDLAIGEDGLSRREALGVVFGSLFWFLWAHARWIPVLIKGGIPVAVQGVVVLYALLVTGLLLLVRSRAGVAPLTGPVLGPRVLRLWWLMVGTFALARLAALPMKPAFLTWLALVGGYVALFRWYHRRCEDPAGMSLVEEILARPVPFSVWKYLKISAVVAVTWTGFQLAVARPGFVKFCAGLSVLLCLVIMLAAVLVPLAAVVFALRGRPADLLSSDP